MAFVYEKFDEEAKKKFLSLGAKLPFGWPSTWAVDKENDIQFIHLGGQGGLPESRGEPPDYCMLIVRGEVLPFEIRYTMEYFPVGHDYKVTILYAQWPDSMLNQVPHFVRMIQDAMFVFWQGNWGANYEVRVSVALIKPISA